MLDKHSSLQTRSSYIPRDVKFLSYNTLVLTLIALNLSTMVSMCFHTLRSEP